MRGIAPSVSERTLAAPPCQGACLRDAWTEFLHQWDWEQFGTFTFREEPGHPEVANKLYRVLVSKVNRELYGKQWHKQGLGITWTLATERQQRGTLHFHTLWGLTGPMLESKDLRFQAMDWWNELAGFARIYPIDNDSAVRGYVSKYVIKGGELTLGGPLEADHPTPYSLPYGDKP